jgi:hypothetical protein
VGIALGSSAAELCAAVDGNDDGEVTVDELVTAVNNALNGCPDYIGSYFGSVNLDDGQTATMNLTTAADGTAEGTVRISDGASGLAAGLAALFQGSGANVLYTFDITGTVNLDTGAYSLSGSFVDATQQTIPVEASGTLPLQAGATGTFTFTLDSVSFEGTIASGSGATPTPTRTAPVPTPTATATPTQSGPTPTSPPIPTPAPGCGGAYGQLTFSNVSADANPNQPLTSLEVTKGSANVVVVSTLNYTTLGGTSALCPVPDFGTSRVIDWTVFKNGYPLVAGDVFRLNESPGPLFPKTFLNYREATAKPSLQTWSATSGTLTVESVTDRQITVRVNAEMAPGMQYPLGPPHAMGTFTLNARVIHDASFTGG